MDRQISKQDSTNKSLFAKLYLYIADLVCRYFGVKVGLYFAFLGHYTTWLIIPTILGILIFLLNGATDQVQNAILLLFEF